MSDLHGSLNGSLRERLEAETPKTTCTLCYYLEQLPPSEVVAWRRVLHLPVTEIGNTAVVCELWRMGIYLSEAAVRRHRRNHA